MVHRSGLQNEVISLYRRALRIVRTKPIGSQIRFRTLIRWTFRRPQVQEAITPRDIAVIEYHLRQARKSVELWENPGVKDLVPTAQMRKWEETKVGRWTRKADSSSSSSVQG
ncbi:hypothetical protein FRB91_004042 [Serendipita sp. 411]|nr:hypothetical protein FRC18_000738 [Serendipita sp. 400]KAG8826292.1 hypothetical protein FRC19_009351 [Serendipita sp. 401]KAG8860254.1 hypothetical protein FRB91_004042 [Serendipita sp. 411]KAG9057162.1 hypothetical protein FS842_008454 [Serendipita sp. 407]